MHVTVTKIPHFLYEDPLKTQMKCFIYNDFLYAMICETNKEWMGRNPPKQSKK